MKFAIDGADLSMEGSGSGSGKGAGSLIKGVSNLGEKWTTIADLEAVVDEGNEASSTKSNAGSEEGEEKFSLRRAVALLELFAHLLEQRDPDIETITLLTCG